MATGSAGGVSKHRDDREHEQSAAWGEVREAALRTLLDGATLYTATPGVYTIASGGRVHRVTTVDQLAAVTRRERARWGVAWPEDPVARRGE